jgi:hypothetical protein
MIMLPPANPEGSVMKFVQRSWKVGLVFFLLLVVFGPLNCTFMDRGPNPTEPSNSVSLTTAANFYASRGLYDDKYGVYVQPGEFVLNIPEAGRHWIFYQTRYAGFAVIVKIEAPALIYVGLNEGEEVTSIFTNAVPDNIALPAAAVQQVAVDPGVKLLVNTQVVPIYTTDVSYCQDEACIAEEMMNWIVRTPSYTWPDGRNEGALADLYQATQGAAFNASAALSQDDDVLGISLLLSSAVVYCDGGCCQADYPCGCSSESEIWNAQDETCTERGENMSGDQVHPPSPPSCTSANCSACTTSSACSSAGCTWSSGSCYN